MRRILHLHSTFDLGGKEARAVALMQAFGPDFEHVIVSAVPGATGAAALIGPEVCFRIDDSFPPLAGPALPARLRRLARAMQSRAPDLVLTYNWGAMDAVMARRLFGGPPLVHHEDGFNADEAERQKRGRIAYRRLALPAAHALVVPSRTLESIARQSWRQPQHRVHVIANGVDAAALAVPPAADAIPGFARRPGELVIGTLAGLKPVKNLPLLVGAFADALRATGVEARLLIAGDGPEAGSIRAAAQAEAIADHLVMPGFLPHPARYVGLFDIFALSSDSEQFPVSLVEAMAAGLPVAATRVGDVAQIVTPENLPLLVPPRDRSALASALAALLVDPERRRQLGAANRRRVEAEFSAAAMVDRYRALYAQAIAAQA